jgi:hypothetical protein
MMKLLKTDLIHRYTTTGQLFRRLRTARVPAMVSELTMPGWVSLAVSITIEREGDGRAMGLPAVLIRRVAGVLAYKPCVG